jgi:hypothetical protein
VQPYLDSLRDGPSAAGRDLYRQLDQAPFPVDIGFGYRSDYYSGQTFPQWDDGKFAGASVGIDFEWITTKSCGRRTVNGTLVHELTHVLQASRGGNEATWSSWTSDNFDVLERSANSATKSYYEQLGWDATKWLNSLPGPWRP